jgi:GNAT superfamily N-acetyltransferase
MLEIQTAQPSDLPPILQLLHTQLQEHDIVLTDQALQRATQGLIEDPKLGRILAARLDGELVGVAVISFLWTLEHGGPAAWLDEVYVEPARRRHWSQARGGGNAGRARQRLHRARPRSRCRS